MVPLRNKGQSSLEYVVLITILIGALLSIQVYFKRGIQGRWKDAVDGLGDQYDPRFAKTDINQTVDANSTSSLMIIPTSNEEDAKMHSYRIDTSSALEKRTGSTTVTSY
ncbi:MAG: hypothetical protein HQL24_09645 [Candidatus Omnitrophica bacterium]|nr:hypothetical protein [Candidatus Omnitrophota bacterium]